MKAIDQQSNEIRIGVAYKFIFGQPGNDTTTLVVTGINDDGTVDTYDVHFKMPVNKIRGDQLWRPLIHKWEAHPTCVKAVTEYAGASALNLE